MCFYGFIHAAKQKCRMYSIKFSFFFFSGQLEINFLSFSRDKHLIVSLLPMAQHHLQHVPRTLNKEEGHSPMNSTLCPVLLSTDTKLLPPELPDFTGLTLEASTVMVWPWRACRRYWGVAHSRSFRIWIMVLMSRFGRPNLSCRAGFNVPAMWKVELAWN